MRLLLIGPPGSGKGTQAVAIANHFGIRHISSGELLRQHIADQTSVGRIAAAYVERGDLVPDGIVMDILRKPVEAASKEGGYVLDGYGGLHQFGNAPAPPPAPYWGRDIARTLAGY